MTIMPPEAEWSHFSISLYSVVVCINTAILYQNHLKIDVLVNLNAGVSEYIETIPLIVRHMSMVHLWKLGYENGSQVVVSVYSVELSTLQAV